MKVRATTGPPIRWGRSLLVGIAAALALALCCPIWLFAQLGGPAPFFYLLLLLAAPLLIVALFLAKAPTVRAGVVCGLSFAAPVTAFCWVLPVLSAAVHDNYLVECWWDGVAGLVVSVLAMVLASFLPRRAPTHPGAQGLPIQAGAPPSTVPPASQSNSGAEGGRPSMS